MQSLLGRLSSIEIKRFKLSLNGHNERWVNGAFMRTIMSIKNLKEVGVEFSIGTVITKENVEHLGNIAHVPYNKGAKSIGFGRIIDQGRAITEMKDASENDLSLA